MPTINEYTPGLVVPQYNTTDYDPTEDITLLAKKQEEYNRVMERVKGLQQQAINVQMLNNEGKERLGAYNQQLSDLLSQDLGDLTEIGNQNRVASFFQNLTGDSQLIQTSALSHQYQQEKDLIDYLKRTGKKSEGYNSVNETVFMEWDGGYNSFVNSSMSDVTSGNWRMEKYTPFKELDTKMINIAKTLHESGDKRSGPTGSAYMLTKGEEGVSPERVRALMGGHFDQEDLEQLNVLSKYEVIKLRKLGGIDQFYNKYNTFADAEIARTTSEADKARQHREHYEGILKDTKATQEQKLEAQELITQLAENEKLYKNRAELLTGAKKSSEDFAAMSNTELLEYASEMQWSNKIASVVDAVSWKKTIEEYKIDPVWKVTTEINAMMEREKFRAETAKSIAAAKAAKAEKDKGPAISGPMDIIENTVDAYTQFETIAADADKFGKASDRIITSATGAGAIPDEKLLDPRWIKENSYNYEVKMWELYKNSNPNAIVNGKAEREKFALWLEQQELNPSGPAGQLVEQFQRDRDVADYLKNKVTTINKAVNAASDEFGFFEGYPLYDSRGQQISKQQYESGTQAYIGLPDGKGGFKLTTVDDAIEGAQKAVEVQSGKTSYGDILTSDIVAAVTAPFSSGLAAASQAFSIAAPLVSKVTTAQGFITGDSPYAADTGLTYRLLQAGERRKARNPTIEKALMQNMPQILQYNHTELLSDDMKIQYFPEVASAFKHADPNKSVGIGLDDLSYIRMPIGGGSVGVAALKPNLAAGAYEGFKVPDLKGNMVEVTPGMQFTFKASTLFPEDAAFNALVDERGVNRTYKGYQIVLKRPASQPQMLDMTILDAKGNQIEFARGQYGDAKQALELCKQKINTLK